MRQHQNYSLLLTITFLLQCISEVIARDQARNSKEPSAAELDELGDEGGVRRVHGQDLGQLSGRKAEAPAAKGDKRLPGSLAARTVGAVDDASPTSN